MSEPLFSNCDLAAVLKNQLAKAGQEIDGCKDEYLLNVSETDFAKYLASNYKVEPIQLGEPFMLDPTEVDVDIGNNPFWGASLHGRRHVKGHRVEIHIPFTGAPDLFRCRPSSFTFSPPCADVRKGYLALVFDRPGQLNAAEIKTEYDRALTQIRGYVANIESECSIFNLGLEVRIHGLISQRRDRLLKIRQAAANIGLPLNRRADAPQTYAVPSIKRKPEIGRPTVLEKAFTPEPALADQEYENILTIIRSMVSVMERSPKAFIGMGEEDLRTHFLVQLNGQYQGRATGETFNYQGKTDILIREDDRNVFIAECKIWKGEGELLKAIDQILSYLHWRDTKTALMVFNRNKSFSDVLAKTGPAVQSHKCCKRLIKKVGETEWRFLFHNPDDSNRELQLAIMLFDIPKEAV
jgi:hypothetical protein